MSIEKLYATNELAELEKKIGYEFTDKSLLVQAMTHSGFTKAENPHSLFHNERLEFLGDQVLGLCVSERLFRDFPESEEGRLTQMRSRVVCRAGLRSAAEKIGLANHLFRRRSGTENGDPGADAILANAVEALIGAVYLDLPAAAKQERVGDFVFRLFREELECAETEELRDAKSRLNAVIQKLRPMAAEYELKSVSGPDHRKSYTVRFKMDGIGYGEGTSANKKNAEQIAAAKTLEQMGNGKNPAE